MNNQVWLVQKRNENVLLDCSMECSTTKDLTWEAMTFVYNLHMYMAWPIQHVGNEYQSLCFIVAFLCFFHM